MDDSKSFLTDVFVIALSEMFSLQQVNFDSLNLNLASAEMRLGAFEAYRIHKYATPRCLIEEISSGKAGSLPVVPRGEARISYKPCRPTVRSNPLESLLPKVKGPEKAQLETLLSGESSLRLMYILYGYFLENFSA